MLINLDIHIGKKNEPSSLALTINKNQFQIKLRSKCGTGKADRGYEQATDKNHNIKWFHT